MNACYVNVNCTDLQFLPNLSLSNILRAVFPILVHEVVGIQLIGMGEAHQVWHRLVV